MVTANDVKGTKSDERENIQVLSDICIQFVDKNITLFVEYD